MRKMFGFGLLCVLVTVVYSYSPWAGNALPVVDASTALVNDTIDGSPLDIYLHCANTLTIDNGAFQIYRFGQSQLWNPNEDPGDLTVMTIYNGRKIGPVIYSHFWNDQWDNCDAGVTITGTGTSADPFMATASYSTVSGGTPLTMDYTVLYTDGDDYFQLSWNLCGGAAFTPVDFYLAGDFYLGGDDKGYGWYHAPSGSVGTYQTDPTTQYMFLTPIDPADHYQEGYFNIAIWGTIDAENDFNDTIDVAEKDTGSGLQWKTMTDGAGCVGKSAFVSFNDILEIPGAEPVLVDKTAVADAHVVTYTITITNVGTLAANPNVLDIFPAEVDATSCEETISGSFSQIPIPTPGNTLTTTASLAAGGTAVYTCVTPFNVAACGQGSLTNHVDVTTPEYSNFATSDTITHTISAGYPTTPTNVQISTDGIDTSLSWDTNVANSGYKVWNYDQNDPYFMPPTGSILLNSWSSNYTHLNGAGSILTQNFYLVEGLTACGEMLGVRKGEFDFSVVPGS